MKKNSKLSLAWLLITSMLAGSLTGESTLTWAAIVSGERTDIASPGNAKHDSENRIDTATDNNAEVWNYATNSNAYEKIETEEIILATASNVSTEYHFLTSDGITVIIDTSNAVLPEDTDIRVERLTEEKQQEVSNLVQNALDDENSTVAETYAYDISFWSEGEEFEPRAEIKVTFQMPENKIADAGTKLSEKLEIFHVSDAGNRAEIMPIERREPYELSCLANEFSIYGIARIGEKVIQIYTAEDLMRYSGGNAKLMNDIDLEGIKPDLSRNLIEVYGTFDGGGYTIRNMCLDSGDGYTIGNVLSLGLFHKASTGKIINVNMEDCNIRIDTSEILDDNVSAINVGILAAHLNTGIGFSGEVSDVHIIDSNITVNDDKEMNIAMGGICALSQGEWNISDCSYSGNMTVNSNGTFCAGGIAGEIRSVNQGSKSTITRCINYGDINFEGKRKESSFLTIGGIAGTAFNIVECVNQGTLSVNNMSGRRSEIGGVCGHWSVMDQGAPLGILQNLYNVGDIEVSQSTNIYIGGICARYDFLGTFEQKYAYVFDVGGNCYQAGSILMESDNEDLHYGSLFGTFILPNCYYIDGTAPIGIQIDDYYPTWKPSALPTGVLSEDMECQETFIGFNFDNVWKMGTDDYAYPIFQWQGNELPYEMAEFDMIPRNGSEGISLMSLYLELTCKSKISSVNFETGKMEIYRADSDERIYEVSESDYGTIFRIEDNKVVLNIDDIFQEDTPYYVTVNSKMFELEDGKIIKIKKNEWCFRTEKIKGITPVYPLPGAEEISYKLGDLYIKLTSPKEIVGYDINKGSIRICEYNTDKVVYQTIENPFSPGSCSDIAYDSAYSKNYFTVNLKTSTSLKNFKPGTKYYILIDKGFLKFEDAEEFGVESKDKWTFYTKLNGQAIIYFKNTGDSIIDDQVIETGTSLETLPVPVKNGYEFMGWYLESSYKNKVYKDTIFYDITTLYGKWEVVQPKTEIIIQFANTGDSSFDPLTLEKDVKVILPIPVKRGYKFEGWYLEDSYRNKVDDNTVFPYSTTLYGKWNRVITISDSSSEKEENSQHGFSFENNNYVYYENGKKITNQWRDFVYGGKLCSRYFDEYGNMCKGWVKLGDDYYFFKDGLGEMHGAYIPVDKVISDISEYADYQKLGQYNQVTSFIYDIDGWTTFLYSFSAVEETLQQIWNSIFDKNTYSGTGFIQSVAKNYMTDTEQCKKQLSDLLNELENTEQFKSVSNTEKNYISLLLTATESYLKSNYEDINLSTAKNIKSGIENALKVSDSAINQSMNDYSKHMEILESLQGMVSANSEFAKVIDAAKAEYQHQIISTLADIAIKEISEGHIQSGASSEADMISISTAIDSLAGTSFKTSFKIIDFITDNFESVNTVEDIVYGNIITSSSIQALNAAQEQLKEAYQSRSATAINEAVSNYVNIFSIAKAAKIKEYETMYKYYESKRIKDNNDWEKINDLYKSITELKNMGICYAAEPA